MKILIVEDQGSYQEEYRMALENDATIISAFTVEDGERLFLENPDIDAIVMDACVPGDRPTTIPLVQKIRETFKGPMIAASSLDSYRKYLMNAGCDHQSSKWDVPDKIREIFGLK